MVMEAGTGIIGRLLRRAIALCKGHEKLYMVLGMRYMSYDK
jgi:hypothetical protein